MIRPPMLPADDVVNLMYLPDVLIPDQAVLATPISSFGNQLAKLRSDFTPHVRV